MNAPAFEAFVKLMGTDRNSLSCLRGDLERQERAEKLAKTAGCVNPAVHGKYMEALSVLLDMVSALEGYERNDVVVFDYKDLADENPTLTETVDAHIPEVAAAEEGTTRWVA